MISYGIVGLPNVGKSTLFNALTHRPHAEVSNYPFCTINPNVGIVAVPDERLERLQKAFGHTRVVPAALEFYDIAGLVRGASRGEGLGNQFLANIREVDAILHVVRCFPDPNVVHVERTLDPVRDVELIESELCLADLETVSRRHSRTRTAAKSGEQKLRHELEQLDIIAAHLDRGDSARTIAAEPDTKALLQDLSLLTSKPVLYIANVAERHEASRAAAARLREYIVNRRDCLVEISARVEAEIAELEPDEATLFRQELGFPEAALERLVRAGYDLLSLITFFTGFRETGAPAEDVRAWTIKEGTAAAAAAGRIHSDMENGFIRAEVIGVDELIQIGSWHRARETAHVATHGRNYTLRDGDVILFRFRAP